MVVRCCKPVGVSGVGNEAPLNAVHGVISVIERQVLSQGSQVTEVVVGEGMRGGASDLEEDDPRTSVVTRSSPLALLVSSVLRNGPKLFKCRKNLH